MHIHSTCDTTGFFELHGGRWGSSAGSLHFRWNVSLCQLDCKFPVTFLTFAKAPALRETPLFHQGAVTGGLIGLAVSLWVSIGAYTANISRPLLNSTIEMCVDLPLTNSTGPPPRYAEDMWVAVTGPNGPFTEIWLHVVRARHDACVPWQSGHFVAFCCVLGPFMDSQARNNGWVPPTLLLYHRSLPDAFISVKDMSKSTCCLTCGILPLVLALLLSLGCWSVWLQVRS